VTTARTATDVQNIQQEQLNKIYDAQQWKCNAVTLFWEILYINIDPKKTGRTYNLYKH
jgi:hypothetical protein